MDLQGCMDHKVHQGLRGIQGRPGTRDRWGNRVTEDKTGLLGKPDLMERLELQVVPENQDFTDLWEREDSQDFLVIQD